MPLVFQLVLRRSNVHLVLLEGLDGLEASVNYVYDSGGNLIKMADVKLNTVEIK